MTFTRSTEMKISLTPEQAEMLSTKEDIGLLLFPANYMTDSSEKGGEENE